ncbi:hypothetical protein [Dactylosporangium sp. NPDC051541]|uniref:DUF7144 family membrane protein n=1 Tax=Dactylosporangium sp. NPDC051541 TaxID=3363977 RepID=UPI00378D9D78
METYRRPFGASLMLVIGIFQVVVGLTAIFQRAFYILAGSYLFGFSVVGWGWVHLALGVLLLLAGGAVLAGQLWGRVVGIVLASLSAIANFLFLPYYPLWSMLIIAADVGVIWSLTRYGREEAVLR